MSQQTIMDKVRFHIKKINKKNIFYYSTVLILSLIFLFFVITTILQTVWVGINDISAPILVWIISQPYVGVFFLPFLILVTYIAWFICSIGKPITIKKVQSDTRILFEDNQLNKSEYDQIYQILLEAADRNKKEYEFRLSQIRNSMNLYTKSKEVIKNEHEKDI